MKRRGETAMLTKSNKSQHKKLSFKQLNAIDFFVQGLTDREVARKVGVRRETVNQWRNHNLEFQAEFNRQRQDVWGAAKETLRHLVPKAVKTLEKEVDKGSLRAAVETLRIVGLYGKVGAPRGYTSAEALELAKKERECLDGTLRRLWKPLLKRHRIEEQIERLDKLIMELGKNGGKTEVLGLPSLSGTIPKDTRSG